jgi:large subunit ribosomal protein L18
VFSGDVRGGNKAGAEAIGKVIADRLKERGITKVVFDRGGNLYHGRIRAVADAARANGLEF